MIAARYSEAHPERMILNPRRIYAHPDHPWALASVDRLTLIAGDAVDLDAPWSPTLEVLEIKTGGHFTADDWADGDDDTEGPEIPQRYLVQGLWYCEVLGVDRVTYAVLTGGQRYREFIVPRDREAGAALLDRCAAFWRMVQEGVEPPVGENPGPDDRLMRRLWAHPDNDKTVALSPAALAALRKLDGLTAEIKRLEAEALAQKVTVQAELADAGVGVDENGDPVVTWRRSDRRSFDRALAKTHAPATLRRYDQGRERYLTPAGDSRRFLNKRPSRRATTMTA